ncbi:hypothetical protein KUTeg_017587 [Tegillarca granosa]|uniref:Caspase family p20 domain-containing protein n=1 Tax=Tegillarca granosa TaxID=220873 RepID=A0ABQ9EH15_TEGGR|nr:hypothetical protein KUTeg_017587 [Tegillarca granosa]
METSTEFSYTFNHKKRGRAIIIVNGDFNEYFDEPVLINGKPERERTGLSKRTCVQNEMKMMKKFFQTLGFNIKCYNDLKAIEMKNVLKQAAENEGKKEEADCFACVICSHGIQAPETETKSTRVYLQHGVAGVDGYFVLIEDIISFFETSNCPALENKPKLFFFQACRGNAEAKTYYENFDVGIPVSLIPNRDCKTKIDTIDKLDRKDFDVEISDADTDSEADDVDYQVSAQLDKSDSPGIYRLPRTDGDNIDTYGLPPDTGHSDVEIVSIPCYSDMLLMFASSEGKFAFSSGLGGWLIQSLYYTMKEYGFKHMDLLTFLNMVTYETVQTRAFNPPKPDDKTDIWRHKNWIYYGSKVTPYITHMLRGDIYFNDSKLKTKKSVIEKNEEILKI